MWAVRFGLDAAKAAKRSDPFRRTKPSVSQWGRKSLKSLGTKFGNFAGSCVFNVLTSISFAVFSHRAKKAASGAVGGLDWHELAFGLDDDPDTIRDNSENGKYFRFFDLETDAPLFDANPRTGTSKRPAQIPTASALQAIYHELGGVTRLRLCLLWPEAV